MKKKILIVDSDIRNLRALNTFIKKKGFEVLTVTEGSLAIYIAVTQKPDIILTNTHLCDTSGIQLCRDLKNHVYTKYIPVVFMSETNDDCQVLNAINSGGHHFISKPASPSIIFDVLTEVLEQLELQIG